MTTTEMGKPKKRLKEIFGGLAALIAGVVFTLIIALTVALFIRAFIVQAFRIPSSAMEPTLLRGDHILVDKKVYGFKIPFTQERFPKNLNPQRGDVIAFIFPVDRTKTFVKRVIGVGGDTVEIRNKLVILNGKEVRSPHAVFRSKEVYSGYSERRDNMKPLKTPEGKLFVMGDNRDFSQDSRFWGSVPAEDVIGKVSKIYLSVTESGQLRWDRLFKPVH
ncbi:MAG: signal peptidase I [Desulfomonilaceae bacterium]